LPKTFNPLKFDPRQWADAAKQAGMKYVVFTTKHHDGFAMFDTKLSDYRITAPDVPFRNHTRSNVVREVFNAFRKKNFAIGDWMKVNGEAIYATRPIAPYKEGQVVFTRKGDTVYAFCLIAQEGEPWPERVGFAGLKPAPHSKVHLLSTRKALSWQTDADGRTTVEIPAGVRKSPPGQHAFALQFTAAGF
jgi:hypothetical protein